jgi:hypothetical protein
MGLLDCVLNNRLEKPYSLPPPLKKANTSQTGDHNDYVLPLLQKHQVVPNLSIKFKHLDLEVDQERITSQLGISDELHSDYTEIPLNNKPPYLMTHPDE